MSCHLCSTITAELGVFMSVNEYVMLMIALLSLESAFPSTQLHDSADIGRLGIYPQS